MRYTGAPWWAQLKSFREGPVWRGYITFQDRAPGQVYRTTTIFRETDPPGPSGALFEPRRSGSDGLSALQAPVAIFGKLFLATEDFGLLGADLQTR